MLTQVEFLQFCQRLQLSDLGREQIETIRSSAPSRRVRSGGRNVCVHFPSRKMGVTIQAESHTVALPGVYEYEYDRDVLEFYDQPAPIKIEYQLKGGRRVGFLNVVDFFILRSNSAGWEEWKSEEDLRKQAEKSDRFFRGEDGLWHCPKGEDHAAQFGLYYRVRSSREIDWIFQRNILFLEDFLLDETPVINGIRAEEIVSRVAKEPGIDLNQLIGGGDPTLNGDIYKLIARCDLYVDLRAAPLAEPERVQVYRDEETARAYGALNEASSHKTESSPRIVRVGINENIVWDGKSFTIVNLGESTLWLRASDGQTVRLPRSEFEALVKQGELTGPTRQEQSEISDEARELIVGASPGDLAEATRRFQYVKDRRMGLREDAALDNHQRENEPAERTVRLWAAKARLAEEKYGLGSGFLGLLPRLSKSGNRKKRLPEDTQLLIDEFVPQYETTVQPKKAEIYKKLALACKERGVYAPSYKTFVKILKLRPTYDQIKKRQGKRAAYVHEPFYWYLELKTPRHGDRPFEIGHIDHKQLDLELVSSRTGQNLGKPWVTFLVDAFSRLLLAIYLTFDPPSYRSCMMILRECVRRHGRLPQIVVVDGGPEFQSMYFEMLLARYEVTKKTRPPAKPRFGTLVERLFGTTDTQFIDNLKGNTQIMKNVRQVTKAVNPKRNACWTLGSLFAFLCEYGYEVYATQEHPALGQSPLEAFETGLARIGERSHRLIPYDEEFMMATLPTTRKGRSKIQPNVGVKVNNIYYWCAAFRDPEVEKTQVPVRFDPFDSGFAYAFVKGRWERCISQYKHAFEGRSEREIMIATAELRKQMQLHGSRSAITAQKLARFLVSADAEGVLLEQRLRDAENKGILPAITIDGQATEYDSIGSKDADRQPLTEEEGALESDYEAIEDTQRHAPPPTIYEDY